MARKSGPFCQTRTSCQLPETALNPTISCTCYDFGRFWHIVRRPLALLALLPPQCAAADAPTAKLQLGCVRTRHIVTYHSICSCEAAVVCVILYAWRRTVGRGCQHSTSRRAADTLPNFDIGSARTLFSNKKASTTDVRTAGFSHVGAVCCARSGMAVEAKTASATPGREIAREASGFA